MAEGSAGSKSKTANKNNDNDSSSEENSNQNRLPESALPWARIYAVADDCQDVEFAWTIKEYTATSKKHEDECVTNACGIVRPGQAAAIVSAMGSAADSMALILTGQHNVPLYEYLLRNLPFCPLVISWFASKEMHCIHCIFYKHLDEGLFILMSQICDIPCNVMQRFILRAFRHTRLYYTIVLTLC